MDTILWLLNHWYVVVWVGAVIVGWNVGGWRLALALGTLGLGVSAYLYGRKSERVNAQARVEKIVKERESAYSEIDARDTDRDDVARRLRDGSY